MQLDQDMHVHSTFSDGRHQPEEVLMSAQIRGIRKLGFADHVRRDTDWLPDYVAHLRELRAQYPATEIVIGVESKMLDPRGTLDIPEDIEGVERILVADHRLPIGADLLGPRQVKERLADGRLQIRDVIDALLCAYQGCVERYSNLQIAHPLSFLAKVGIPEWRMPMVTLYRLACFMAARAVVVEVSERWRCPSPSIIRVMRRAGVTVVASTDAHDANDVGCYQYVKAMAASAVGPAVEDAGRYQYMKTATASAVSHAIEEVGHQYVRTSECRLS